MDTKQAVFQIIKKPLKVMTLSGTSTYIPAGVIKIVGFTSSGVKYGSLAAYIQSMIGSVQAQSLFALLQSSGATGALIPGVGTIFIVVAVSGGAYSVYKYHINPQLIANSDKINTKNIISEDSSNEIQIKKSKLSLQALKDILSKISLQNNSENVNVQNKKSTNKLQFITKYLPTLNKPKL